MESKISSGFLFINKPKNSSSFRVVAQVKKLVGKKIKVGHTGTLDEFATGLLIICIGRSATKHVPSLMNLDKTYVVKAKLGELTDTLDCKGTVILESKKLPSREQLEEAIKSFGSSYEQVPPVYSALKHKGTPLYELARKEKKSPEELQQITEQKKRLVSLYELTLLSFQPPYFTIRARVSKGTYVRSLANDIATRAKSIATCYELSREAIGPFTLEQAYQIDEITSHETLEKKIISVETMLHMINTALELPHCKKHKN